MFLLYGFNKGRSLVRPPSSRSKRVGRSGDPTRPSEPRAGRTGRSVGTPDPKICFAALRAAGRSVGRTESGSQKSEKEGRSAGMLSPLKTSHRQWHCWVLGEIWLGGVIWGHIWVHPAKGLTVTGPLGRVDSEKGGFQSPIRSS